MVISIVNAVVNFWFLGVSLNYAMRRHSLWAEQVRKAREIEGRLNPEEELWLHKIGNMLQAEAIPDWLIWITNVTTMMGLILFIVYWFIK